MIMKHREALAWGGVVGPAGFVTAWATAGALTKGYSPVGQAISQLGAARAPMRHLMRAGFVCYGVAVPAYGVALRDSLGGRAWIAATVAGSATLGAGAFPLDTSSTNDRVHRGCAVVGSVSLALAPVVAAQALSAHGYGRSAAASRLVGVLSCACLAASAYAPTEGLLQRAGLTLANGWIAASAVAIGTGRLQPSRVRQRDRRVRTTRTARPPILER